MEARITRCILGAGLSFTLMVALGVILYPEILHHANEGINTFGARPHTRPVFYAGFAAATAFLLLLARALKPQHNHKDTPVLVLQTSLRTVAACLAGVAITSWLDGQPWFIAHAVFAGSAVFASLATAVYFGSRRQLGATDYALLALIIAATLASALPLDAGVALVVRELVLFLAMLLFLGRQALSLAGLRS